ncbi:MAG TPA: hypothetical protein GX708_22035 [Gallicola sp.]|nr:hypothetical protein [Gallicola sp.]
MKKEYNISLKNALKFYKKYGIKEYYFNENRFFIDTKRNTYSMHRQGKRVTVIPILLPCK